MYLMVLTNGWRNYHVMSPNLLLLENAGTLPEFSVHGIDDEVGAWRARASLSEAKAIICDTVCWRYFQDIKNIPKILISVDAHALYANQYEEYVKAFEWADYILSPYSLVSNAADRIYHLPKKFKHKTIFFPHFVDGKSVTCQEKTIEAALSGAISDTYPFRQMAQELPWLHRPAIHTEIVKRDYLDYIAKARVGVTCNSRIGYTVAKYFEIPFAGTLLYAPAIRSTLESELLGYGDRMMEIATEKTSQEIEQRLLQILADFENRKQKIETAQRLIQNRHTVKHRLKYLLSLLDRINTGNYMVYDQFDLFLDSFDHVD